MPEDPAQQGPEELLAGSDRPRQLPPALRARLEEALAGPSQAQHSTRGASSAGDHPAPNLPAPNLPAGARGRLEGRLVARQRWRKWGPLAGLAVAAAAVAVVVAIAIPGSPRQRVAAPEGRAVRVPNAVPVRLSPASRAAASAAKAAGGGIGAHAAVPAARPSAFGGFRGPASPAGTKTTKATHATLGSPAKTPQVAPIVTAVVPESGPEKGGNWVTLMGNGLGNVRAVYFGGVRATKLQVVSAGEVRALAPAHTPGKVTVSAGEPPVAGAGPNYTFTEA